VFESFRQREGTPSRTVAGTTLELDVVTRDIKLTIDGATRRFLMSQGGTLSTSCEGRAQEETRTVDAPNIQVGEVLIDEPLLRAECPLGSGVVVLQTGPLQPTGAAPACSQEKVCLAYRTQAR
jgi:hypothetical protein